MALVSATVFGFGCVLGGKALWSFTMIGESFIYLSILTLILVLFVSKEPTSLFIYMATNGVDASLRFKAPFVYIGLVVQLINLFWLDHYQGGVW